MLKTKINPDKIRDIIGKGGATIRSITEESGATVDDLGRHGADPKRARLGAGLGTAHLVGSGGTWETG